MDFLSGQIETRLRGLRICFLAGTLGQGGAERQLFYNLQCLVKQGAKVNLLCLTKGEYWERHISNLQIPIHYIGTSRSRLARVLRIYKIVRRIRPHVVQCQHFYTGIYAATAAKCLRIPSIGAIRSNGFGEIQANGPIWSYLSLTLPNWIAANSEEAIRNLCSLGHNSSRFLLLPNVIDTTHFRPAPRSRSENQFVILGVGSLEKVKRFDRFLTIVASLRNRIGITLRVVIAGDGQERREVEILAEKTRKLGIVVELPGRITDPMPLLLQANALLLTSDREGTPNVIMEAMACGLPVVATDVGGVSELITHKVTGFLFQPENHEMALTALGTLRPGSPMAASIANNARQFIERHRSLVCFPSILDQFYRQILGLNQRFDTCRQSDWEVAHPAKGSSTRRRRFN